ncbi:MAG: hypothetical protein K8S23_09150 [Candidatus Cloacimonetes bacterium]|nr:hypothetical protein [Candidatus Cloacimonadota bacterium]
MKNTRTLTLHVRSALSDTKKVIKLYEKTSYKEDDTNIKRFFKYIAEEKKQNLSLIQKFFQHRGNEKGLDFFREELVKFSRTKSFSFPHGFIEKIKEEPGEINSIIKSYRNERNSMKNYRKLFYETDDKMLKFFFGMMFKIQRHNFKNFYDVFLSLEQQD